MTASSVQTNSTGGTRMATNSYTEGGVTVHDEKVILGEQYLPTYAIVWVAAQSTATANSHILQIMAGSSLNVYIRRIQLYQLGMATTVAQMQVTLVRLSTAGTGGTVVTPVALDTSDAASGATAMLLPTGKGTEGATNWSGAATMLQTLGASTLVPPLLDLDFDKMLRGKVPRIAAGTTNGYAVKNLTAVAAGTVVGVAYITEASF